MNREIKQKALELNENPRFKASKNWVRNFLKRIN